MNEKQREIQDKCIAFAVEIDALRKMLNKKHHEYNKADQIDRSASSIGANYSEAVHSESEADYIHKLGTVYKLKKSFPDMPISINGNVLTLDDTEKHLTHMDGVMIGRVAYGNPYLMKDIDARFYGDKHPIPTRAEGRP